LPFTFYLFTFEIMLNLEIVTPEKMVLSESVDSVTIPTASGEIGIMTNHAPLISSLRAGILSYTRGGATEKLVISGGFVEVSANNVSVLADIAEESSEVDTEAARLEREAAERVVKEWKGTEEELEAELEKLERAQARLQLAAGK
jgi:F-type H+-transporting ATPase subunit epsilon